MATAGALVGASIAGLAYKLSGQNYILTFALATIPATMALVITCTVGASSTCEHALCRSILISGMCRIRQCLLCSAGMEIAIEYRGMNPPQTNMCACRHLATWRSQQGRLRSGPRVRVLSVEHGQVTALFALLDVPFVRTIISLELAYVSIVRRLSFMQPGPLQSLLVPDTGTFGDAAAADARPDSEKAADVNLTLPEKASTTVS